MDYLEKPFDADQLEHLVRRALDRPRESAAPADDPSAALLGSGPAMRSLRERIARIAPADETVLICGESGVGKELAARSLHARSRRAAAPLVSVNCPALAPALLESELFGHERGAFTGADAARAGRFEAAEGGALFLDEIGEIEPPLQAKLLRVLQEKTLERVGSTTTRRIDVRVLAATNRDLRVEAEAGRFRLDLYFRLAVVPLTIPPLRERREDVPELAEHFLARAARRLDREPRRLTAGALTLLGEYRWPGNVRELENLLTRATVLGGEQAVDADELRPWLLEAPGAAIPRSEAELPAASPGVPVGTSLQAMERALVEATLEHYHGHRERTARALGIGVRTLANKLRGYGYAPRERAFVGDAAPVRENG